MEPNKSYLDEEVMKITLHLLFYQTGVFCQRLTRLVLYRKLDNDGGVYMHYLNATKKY
jgi:hypothetical protein